MKISTFIKRGLAVATLCIASQAFAGNIPQYSFQQSRPAFEFLTDATPVKVTYAEAPEMVYPGRQVITSYTGEGFPIGFDFRFGGREFNQFAINNNGYILLGKDNVPFYGYANMFFDETGRYGSNYFYMGVAPSMYGVAEGEISYKLEGNAGDRRLIVQFAHIGVNEPSRLTRGNAIYSLQIVLFEKDGKVNINFLEEESPYTSFGLVCGLHGWSNDDSMLLTSSSLGNDATISSSNIATMLTPGSLLHWSADDVLGDGHTDPYSFSFSFIPTGAKDFVCDAPDNLSIDQHSNTIEVICDRPSNAPATAILISEKPILELPEQGMSYQVKNDAGDYVTKFGDATLIYYSDDEHPKAEFNNVKPSTRYYIKAFGVNGYPWYSNETSADAEFFTSHPAPYLMQATSAKDAINLMTMGEDDIVIATTLERAKTQPEGVSGIFGEPAEKCAVGDMIEGGGEIIYIGAPGDFTYENPAPNRQVFFRAWALRDGRISKTSINASGVTEPSMPYEPQLELYTLYEPPLNWIAQTTSTSSTVTTNFVPRTRGNDDEPVVGGVSASSSASLTSPLIKFGEDATLKFEWAMETTRELGDQGDALVQLPEGNEPGKFGQGHSFKVVCKGRGSETEVFTTSAYNGTMTVSPNDPDHYISGTSTFIPVEVKLPATVTSGTITFSFSTEMESILYLRNISITSASGVETLFGEAAASDVICGGEGSLSILSAKGGEYTIHTLDGRLVAAFGIAAGEGRVVSLDKGIYIAGGRKVIVK